MNELDREFDDKHAILSEEGTLRSKLVSPASQSIKSKKVDSFVQSHISDDVLKSHFSYRGMWKLGVKDGFGIENMDLKKLIKDTKKARDD